MQRRREAQQYVNAEFLPLRAFLLIVVYALIFINVFA